MLTAGPVQRTGWTQTVLTLGTALAALSVAACSQPVTGHPVAAEAASAATTAAQPAVPLTEHALDNECLLSDREISELTGSNSMADGRCGPNAQMAVGAIAAATT